MALTAFGINCTLKPSPAPSSSQKMLDEILQALHGHGIAGSSQRLVDLDVKPGVTADEGEGDAWPVVRRKILAADILVLATPIWLGWQAMQRTSRNCCMLRPILGHEVRPIAQRPRNAARIRHATGIRLRDLPVTADKLPSSERHQCVRMQRTFTTRAVACTKTSQRHANHVGVRASA